MKGDFIDNLPKIYGLYTGGFIVFVALMAILEQVGFSAQAIGILFVAFTVAIYAGIGWLSRTMQVDAYYVAGRQVPAVFNGMATAADTGEIDFPLCDIDRIGKGVVLHQRAIPCSDASLDVAVQGDLGDKLGAGFGESDEVCQGQYRRRTAPELQRHKRFRDIDQRFAERIRYFRNPFNTILL